MVNINWQFQTTIPGGPAFIINNQPNIQVDGYDLVAVTIPASTPSLAVPIQPSTGTGDVLFLVITSSKYDAGISYTVDSITTNHVLDGPHVLIGSGAVAFLNSSAPPQKLTFDNTLTTSVNVQVVVGRKIA